MTPPPHDTGFHHPTEDLETIVSRAVAKAIAEHACRFSQGEAKRLHEIAECLTPERAKVLHEVSERLTVDRVISLSLLAQGMNNVGARLGQAVVWLLFGAVATAVTWAVAHGLLPGE